MDYVITISGRVNGVSEEQVKVGRSVRLTAANEVAKSLRGNFGAPLRREFLVRTEKGEPTPLNQLMSSTAAAGGGRGGRQRLALLVTALWVCSRPPHSTRRSASWWAEMIGLPDPSGQAATRSVIANLRELARRRFIDLQAGRDGNLPVVTLRSELGTGDPYVRPRLDAYPNYVRIPETLWTRDNLISKLDARALAMYLIVLYYYNATTGAEIWFSNDRFRELHGMAEATRLNGLNQLVNLHVVTMREDYVAAAVGVEYRTTKRRFYSLDPLYAPAEAPKPNPDNPKPADKDDPWSSRDTAQSPVASPRPAT